MTCINNSVVSGLILTSSVDANSLEAVNSGRRLAFLQNTSVNWDSAIIAGDVIRYDVDDAIFTRSIADPTYDNNGLSNAEVVGIVESIDKIQGITYATIVVHGLMNYPGLTATIEGICASSGGVGGTDIFFLSPNIPGGITAELFEGSGLIAKPVLQVCPTSDEKYNSIVINYLGYETSNPADFTIATSEGSITEIKILPKFSSVAGDFITSPIPDGWIDCSIVNWLPVLEYSKLYNIIGRKEGFREKITVSSDSFLLSTWNDILLSGGSVKIKPVGTAPPTPSVPIISIDVINSQIIIEHPPNSSVTPREQLPIADIIYYSYTTLYNEEVSSGQLSTVAGEILEFRVPIISLGSQVLLFGGNTTGDIPWFGKIIMRVKDDTRVSYLPDEVTLKNVTISGTLKTANQTDVDSELISLSNRISALENILGI